MISSSEFPELLVSHILVYHSINLDTYFIFVILYSIFLVLYSVKYEYKSIDLE